SLHSVNGSVLPQFKPSLSPFKPSLTPRLLEADSKSLRSVNGSRRSSGSSLVSSSSASSQLGQPEEDSWILWGRIVNDWDEWRRKKEKLLKELIRKGIPHHFRAIVWQLLCSAPELPLKAQYSELLRMSSPCERLIRRDIARTYPEHDFFRGQDSLGQEVLFNVMKAYSLVDREVGYCQGSAFIVGLLLMQMPEEEAFSVFVRLMQQYRLRELFKPSMAQLGLCIYQFEFLLQEQLPELNVHFRSQSFLTSMYASSWFLTLFLTTFPLPVATRVFDIFMYEGLEIVFRVGMALLQLNQAELVQLDMEGMSQYFQKVIPHQFDSCPDKLILRACQVKYNPRKMKRWGHVTVTVSLSPVCHLCRLRSENRLLKQRIETLEKVRPRNTKIEFVAHLETELERSRLRESQTLGALQEMRDKVLDMEKGALQEMRDKVLDMEKGTLRGHWGQGALKEMRDKVLDMEKDRIQRSVLGRAEQACAGLREQLRAAAAQSQGLQAQLSESHRKHAEAQCKSKEEVMAVRLREADSMAALAEMRQRVAELEIQVRGHGDMGTEGTWGHGDSGDTGTWGHGGHRDRGDNGGHWGHWGNSGDMGDTGDSGDIGDSGDGTPGTLGTSGTLGPWGHRDRCPQCPLVSPAGGGAAAGPAAALGHGAVHPAPEGTHPPAPR
uniref:Ecotropic viral integration site 5 like n=1 Tax=Catharus ustulatus TaxID=91951 RepID=A0A8C3ULS0_CATUS